MPQAAFWLSHSSLLYLREFITTQRAHLLKAAASVEFDSFEAQEKLAKLNRIHPHLYVILGLVERLMQENYLVRNDIRSRTMPVFFSDCQRQC